MDNLSLYHELEKVLRMDSNYCTEIGELKKNSIIEAALNLNPQLIKILLSNERLKKTFFVDVEGVSVFDKVAFQRFVMNKRFLPDSYTSFKNKIGLIDDNYDFVSESRDLVLSFPYKDCILEGGQTKEDAKRNEIFWNETLAPDDINRIIEPKALTNVVKYDVNGKNKVAQISPKDNIILRGNNLLALYSLNEKFAGKVKLIYIDPPYFFNKNSASDAFKYNSNFRFSTWMVFMRNRLEIAKKLLQPGGTIWINIGEDGMHYLKVLADEIFGRDSFIGTLPRRTRNGKNDVPFNFSQDFDWILVYTNVSGENKILGRNVKRKYYVSEDYPNRPWRICDLTKQTTAKERPNSNFTMVDPKTGKEYPASEKRSWAVTKDTFQSYYDNGYIIFPDDYEFLDITKPYARKFKDEDDNSGKLSTIISDFIIKDFLKSILSNCKNKDGNDEIDELFGRDEFPYAKPENLIKTILEVATSEGDLVLDFFLGSGTTAAVAHKMNRQYIGVDQMDYIETLAVERLKKVIAGEQGGVSKVLEWKGGGSFIYCELAKANQLFIDRIIQADKKDEAMTIWNDIQKTGFISWKIYPESINEKVKEIDKLSLEDLKKFLIEVLDKNMLYIPYNDIEDSNYNISEEVKDLNKKFYGR